MEFYDKKRKRTTSTTWETRNRYSRQDEDLNRINAIVNNIFKKSFTISGNEKYTLPKPETMFNSKPWIVEELQKIKSNLNETKSKLNNYPINIWQQHTSQRNKAKDIEWQISKHFEPEFVTQAWCKFHEIVSKYSLVPKEKIFSNNNKFISLHLCEAPGAFITCLNHYLKTNLPTVNWDWLAMSFNPYYEGNSNHKMIIDDRFIIYTLEKWFFGKDYTGNLMLLENLDALIERTKAKGKIDLITADGSINCMNNPGEQEIIVSSLHYCEVVAALHILETGGNFLLKIFTTFEHQSVCLIYLLSCIFKNLHFYKPVTSKEGNSEVYLICINFKGFHYISSYSDILKKEYGKSSTTAMFHKNDIPDSFIEQIVSCANIFKNYQCEVIINNIIAYNSTNLETNYENKNIAKLVANKYIETFPLQKLHRDLQIVGNMRLKKSKFIDRPSAESFNERQKKNNLKPLYRLIMYEDQLKNFEPISQSLIFKTTNFHPSICIATGKPYDRIQSSKFCSVQISEIYDLLFQSIDTEKNIQISLPTEEKIMNYEKKIIKHINSTCKIVNFKYTQIYSKNETFLSIKTSLTDLKLGENLILLGYQLLTQFHVGLIYLLTHTFECVEFFTDEEIGCAIVLKYFKNNELVLQSIEEIYKIAKSEEDNNKVVISLIPVAELHDSELYSIVYKLNNWIAKYCVNSIALFCNEYRKQETPMN